MQNHSNSAYLHQTRIWVLKKHYLIKCYEYSFTWIYFCLTHAFSAVYIQSVLQFRRATHQSSHFPPYYL